MNKNVILLIIGSIVLCAVLGFTIRPVIGVFVFMVFGVGFLLIGGFQTFIVSKWKFLKTASKDSVQEYIFYRISYKELVEQDIEKLSPPEKEALYNLIVNGLSEQEFVDIDCDSGILEEIREIIKENLYQSKDY